MLTHCYSKIFGLIFYQIRLRFRLQMDAEPLPQPLPKYSTSLKLEISTANVQLISTSFDMSSANPENSQRNVVSETQAFQFLELPPEIRVLIYEEVFHKSIIESRPEHYFALVSILWRDLPLPQSPRRHRSLKRHNSLIHPEKAITDFVSKTKVNSGLRNETKYYAHKGLDNFRKQTVAVNVVGCPSILPFEIIPASPGRIDQTTALEYSTWSSATVNLQMLAQIQTIILNFRSGVYQNDVIVFLILLEDLVWPYPKSRNDVVLTFRTRKCTAELWEGDSIRSSHDLPAKNLDEATVISDDLTQTLVAGFRAQNILARVVSERTEIPGIVW